jgi:alpha-L-fucosidase
VAASNVRGSSSEFHAANLLDGNPDTYWATDDDVTTAQVVVEFPRQVRFDFVRVREKIRLGQRVEGIAVDSFSDGNWRPLGSATGVGACRILATSGPVTTDRVRLRVTGSAVCPALSEFGLFANS